MSASSPATLDLADRNDLRWLAALLADVRRAVPAAEPLLVGALARDLLLHYGHGIPVARATEDVDLAFAVEDWQTFASVREALLAGGAFATYRGAIQKLRHREHGWIDLLPFGAVERLDGTIAWPPGGEVVMGVLGYSEANATATRVALPQAEMVRVVCLPLLAVLKVLAWKDRHALAPGKDAADLMLILRSYLEAGNEERLYGDFASLLTDDFDFEQTSAWLVGRDALGLIQQHSSRAGLLIRILTDVLRAELAMDGALTLVFQMNASDPERAERLLAAFHRGMIGADAP